MRHVSARHSASPHQSPAHHVSVHHSHQHELLIFLNHFTLQPVIRSHSTSGSTIKPTTPHTNKSLHQYASQQVLRPATPIHSLQIVHYTHSYSTITTQPHSITCSPATPHQWLTQSTIPTSNDPQHRHIPQHVFPPRYITPRQYTRHAVYTPYHTYLPLHITPAS